MNKNDRKIAIAALCVAVMVSVLLFFSEGRTPSSKGKVLESNRQNTAVRKAKYYGSYGSEQRKETFPFDQSTTVRMGRNNVKKRSPSTQIRLTARNCYAWDCNPGKCVTSINTVHGVASTAKRRTLPSSTD